jgi:hypothetical protein
MPWALAHSRTSVVFRAFGCALRPLRAGRLVLTPARRPAAAHGQGVKAFGAEWYVLGAGGSKIDTS